jgi:hypothetical protein
VLHKSSLHSASCTVKHCVSVITTSVVSRLQSVSLPLTCELCVSALPSTLRVLALTLCPALVVPCLHWCPASHMMNPRCPQIPALRCSEPSLLRATLLSTHAEQQPVSSVLKSSDSAALLYTAAARWRIISCASGRGVWGSDERFGRPTTAGAAVMG